MSKSAPDGNSRILLTDSPQEIKSKIKRAVTDDEQILSYDPESRPGVSNLLGILAALQSRLPANGDERKADPAQVADELNKAKGGAAGAGTLKAALTEVVIQTLQPIQSEMERLQNEAGYLDRLSNEGAEKANAIASRTMKEVREAVGLE
jgi:tryptophanyl-tRNA synthetase